MTESKKKAWDETLFLLVIVYGPATPILFADGLLPWLCVVALMTLALLGMLWTFSMALGSGIGGGQ